ncbi:hypothetical protein [Rhizobium sp. TRM95796]|uniref:hypothetical protein n=1 Tax=Rhizobium sp. TRM95796 TaxID=2979862 RepID=UPI0021E73D0F|nr:hypothetical protein [Rhizobium sp. TRM95796]MCV3768714.1 hypothetical protein [Rhizobium sp. TRM95796]
MRPLYTVAVLPALLAGCAATTPAEITAYRDPADPSAETISTRYRSPVAYTARVPVDPEPWKKLNEDISSDEGDAS